MTTRYFKFVRFEDVPEHERRGWIVCETNLGPGHGQYSLLMEWGGMWAVLKSWLLHWRD